MAYLSLAFNTKAITCSTYVLCLWLLTSPSMHTSLEANSKPFSIVCFTKSINSWILGPSATRWQVASAVEPVSPGSLRLMMPMAGWSYWQCLTLTAKQSASRFCGLMVCACVCVSECVRERKKKRSMYLCVFNSSQQTSIFQRFLCEDRVSLTSKPPLGPHKEVVCLGCRSAWIIILKKQQQQKKQQWQVRGQAR